MGIIVFILQQTPASVQPSMEEWTLWPAVYAGVVPNLIVGPCKGMGVPEIPNTSTQQHSVHGAERICSGLLLYWVCLFMGFSVCKGLSLEEQKRNPTVCYTPTTVCYIHKCFELQTISFCNYDEVHHAWASDGSINFLKQLLSFVVLQGVHSYYVWHWWKWSSSWHGLALKFRRAENTHTHTYTHVGMRDKFNRLHILIKGDLIGTKLVLSSLPKLYTGVQTATHIQTSIALF